MRPLRRETAHIAESPSPIADAGLAPSSGPQASSFRRKGVFASLAIGLLALVGVVASVAAAPDLRGVLGAALALLMLAIAVVDARRFIIPNELSFAALALALIHAAVSEPGAVMEAVADAALRGLVLALVFLGLREGYVRLRGREGLGLGDVKLAGVGGAWLGWSMMPIAVEIAALAALAYYGVRHAAGVRPVGATSRIPFGLFLAPAIWLGWLVETLLNAL